MSHIATSDLVRCADRYAVAGLRAEVALLLNDYYDAIAWGMSVHGFLPFFFVLIWWFPMVYVNVPTFAARFDRKTLTHSTMAAPELSMQLTRV